MVRGPLVTAPRLLKRVRGNLTQGDICRRGTLVLVLGQAAILEGSFVERGRDLHPGIRVPAANPRPSVDRGPAVLAEALKCHTSVIEL
jgi:hypothetical protein